MTSFWRPIAKGADPAAWGASREPREGQLYALWARCDLCFDSSPFDDFTVYERGIQYLTVCAMCQSDDFRIAPLLHEGWDRR